MPETYQIGVGLRPTHYPHLRKRPRTEVQWFEAISENYMDSGGAPLKMLELIRQNFPVALHGVSLSIGSHAPVSLDYLTRLKTLIDRIDPFLVSDHLCWTGVEGANLHDLFPLPFTDESHRHLCQKLDQVQSFLRRPILLENVSSYLTYSHSTMTEWDFLVTVARHSGCKLLLDLNNVYVSAKNHGFDADTFISSIPADLVGQIHLAGFTDMGDYLFDTHSKPVYPDVWELYRRHAPKLADIPVLVEWDDDIPAFEVLEAEAVKARTILEEANRG